MVDDNDCMEYLSGMQRHRLLLHLQGLSVPIFLYTWAWGGCGAGTNLHVIWRIPLESQKEERVEGMNMSPKNNDFLNKNTIIYHTRAERSAYLAYVVNKNFVNISTVAQAIYEFITWDVMFTNFTTGEASEAARYAFNCHNTDIIIDIRKLNARPKSKIFDQFWAKMAEIVDERVCDRRHGKMI